MPITELKCIEILIRHLANGTSLTKEIYSEFAEIETFENAKTNLFNLISIFNLLDNYSDSPSFSLESFLFTGTIPGIYEDKTFTPSLDVRYLHDYKSFYRYLLEALQEENYLFDESNNLFVSSTKIETTVPQVWLYRLAEAVKRTTYKRVYFFNKNKENNIIDKNALLDYLRHTKTFVVELTSKDPNIDYDFEFICAQAKTNSQIRHQKSIKVETITESFKSNLPDTCQARISKYKLSDALWLISKAEQMGREFYTESLDVQQKYINKWLLEFINSNDLNNNEAQKYILLANPHKDSPSRMSDLDKKEALAGLFSLYIRLLKSIKPDFTCVSISEFKIETYLSKNLQENLILLNHLIKQINKDDATRALTSQQVQSILEEISQLDAKSDEIRSKKSLYYRLLNDYNLMEKTAETHNEQRRVLQNAIQEEQKNSVESIAFDNEKIMELITACTESGRIYFKQGTNQLVAELYNDELGKTIFRTSINLAKLITFIENLNYSIEELSVPLR